MAHRFKAILICLLIPVLSYGQINFFRTHSEVVTGMADILTTVVTGVTETTATGGGNVLTDNGSSVTDRGICWTTHGNPVITDSHTHDGTGTGIFASDITGLSAGTAYWVRAYAINGNGTAYGLNVYFVASTAAKTLPSVTTGAISDIVNYAAIGSGNVTATGNDPPVTARGLCWSTSINPDLTNFYSVEGSGLGSFSGSMTGLASCTMYHVRAYATSGAGTAYGDDVMFMTCRYPSLPNNWVFHWGAKISGTVTDYRGACSTARTFCGILIDYFDGVEYPGLEAIYGDQLIYIAHNPVAVGDRVYDYDPNNCACGYFLSDGWYVAHIVHSTALYIVHLESSIITAVTTYDDGC